MRMTQNGRIWSSSHIATTFQFGVPFAFELIYVSRLRTGDDVAKVGV